MKRNFCITSFQYFPIHLLLLFINLLIYLIYRMFRLFHCSFDLITAKFAIHFVFEITMVTFLFECYSALLTAPFYFC